MKQRVERIVEMKNLLANVVNEHAPQVLEKIKTLKGEKVYTVNGHRTKSSEVIFEEITTNGNVKTTKNGCFVWQSYIQRQHRFLYVVFSASFNGGSYEDRTYFHVSTKASIFIGRADNGVLNEVENELPKMQKIKVLDQMNKIAAYKKAEEKMRELRAQIDSDIVEQFNLNRR
jgi:zona occludens toxin (predicted ATPase)